MNYNELKETTKKKWKIAKNLNRIVREMEETDFHLTSLIDTNGLSELYTKTYEESLLLRKEDKYRANGYERTISFRELQKINLRKTYSFDVINYTYYEILDKLSGSIYRDFGCSHFEVAVRLEANSRIIGMVTLAGHFNQLTIVINEEDIEGAITCDESTWYMCTNNTFAKVDKERLINNISVLKLMLQN